MSVLKSSLTSPSRQRGVALITAVLIVALASIAATEMAVRQQVNLRRAANVLEADKAQLYLYGATVWAEHLLARDLKDNKTDSLQDDWAQELPPLLLEEGGSISGKIEDLQGRFNPNNLLGNEGVNDAELKRFHRLLDALELPRELATAIIDWIDSDQEARFDGGAEDSFYMGQMVPAYRTANQFFTSISELRLVKGITPAVYETLLPHVFVAPEPTEINVNTATVPVIMSLAEGIERSDAEKIVENRNNEAYEKVADFLQEDVLAGTGIKASGLSVASRYFILTAEAAVGRVVRRQKSVIQRTSATKVETVMFSLGEL